MPLKHELDRLRPRMGILWSGMVLSDLSGTGGALSCMKDPLSPEIGPSDRKLVLSGLSRTTSNLAIFFLVDFGAS